MSVGDRSAPPAFLDEVCQWPRQAVFEEAHPGAEFSRAGGMHVAYVPLTRGGYTVVRGSLREVLDAMDDFFRSSG